MAWSGFSLLQCAAFTLGHQFLHFFSNFKDQEQIWNLLVMRIPKLSLIVEIDEEMTEIFKVKVKAQFPKSD